MGDKRRVYREWIGLHVGIHDRDLPGPVRRHQGFLRERIKEWRENQMENRCEDACQEDGEHAQQYRAYGIGDFLVGGFNGAHGAIRR